MYECLLEVALPNNEIKQYELWDKLSNLRLKQLVFRITVALQDVDQSDFHFFISKDEPLSCEFYDYIQREEQKERTNNGLPIKLILKYISSNNNNNHNGSDNNFSSNPSLRNSDGVSTLNPNHNNNNSSELGKFGKVESTPLVSGGLGLKLEGLTLNLPDEKGRSRAGTAGLVSPRSNSNRKRAGTGDPAGLLSPRGMSNSSPSSSPISSAGRFKNLFKSSSSCPKLATMKSTPDVRRKSADVKKALFSSQEVKIEEFSSYSDADLVPQLLAKDQFGYHYELGFKSAFPLNINSLFLEVPRQENLYQKYFVANDHKNYIGVIEGIGPIIISTMKSEEKDSKYWRGLIRLPQKTFHVCTDYSGQSTSLKCILSRLHHDLPHKSFKKVKNPDLVKELDSFDQSHIIKKYKFGVLYCKENQLTEEEWFSNEHGSEELYEFLNILGDKIVLNGWKNFRGGLDVKTDTTGLESYYTEYANNEIMFHVSTLLPFAPSDDQKIERKRHIGNDIAVIIFKEGNTPFPPAICKSVFNHCYIVVSKENEQFYRVEIAVKDGVKQFSPHLPNPPLLSKNSIRAFLLTKMINAEWAAYRSLEFSHKMKRTRQQQLNEIVKNVTNNK